MNKEELLLLKRMKDLAFQADVRGYSTFTDFLNLNEMNILYSSLKEFPSVNYYLWGGYEEAERKVLCFYNGTISTNEFDITMVEIKPVSHKFSDDLSHRDFLGALINLGIDRSKLGDILIKDNVGYVFTTPVIGQFIIDQLNKIKHTNVTCNTRTLTDIDIKPNLKEIRGSISSVRLDSLIALAFNTSRSSMTGLISGGKVFVNGKLTESNSFVPKEGDIVSVRGHGRFIYRGITNQTKKGRFFATVLKYI